MLKKIFNADDFGISEGVNQAIVTAHTKGALNSTSLMVTMARTEEAVKLSKQMPNLSIGLHANLTNEQAVLPHKDIPLLIDENGRFKNGFVALALLSVLHPKELKRQAKAEIKAQIDKAVGLGVSLSHLDSHRHIHMIPSIFKACLELKAQYAIPRLRFINENPLRTIQTTPTKEWLSDGGLIKSLVLSACAVADKLLFGFRANTYFYSIVNTCKISRDKLRNITVPKGYLAVEVMLHPGMPEVDRAHPEEIFDDNILSPWRTKELETLLDKTIEQEFKQPL